MGRSVEWVPPGPGKYCVELAVRGLDEWVPRVDPNPIELRADAGSIAGHFGGRGLQQLHEIVRHTRPETRPKAWFVAGQGTPRLGFPWAAGATILFFRLRKRAVLCL